MSDGVTHHEYWKKGLVPVGIACAIGFATGFFYWNGYPAMFFLWTFLSYLSGRYVDPDLDQEGITSAEGRMGRELGFFGLLWKWWWMLYALLLGYAIKRLKIRGAIGGTHRTILSHSIVPGTPIRMFFLDFPFYLMIYFVNNMMENHALGSISFATPDLVVFFSAQFLGLGMADFIHLKLDNIH